MSGAAETSTTPVFQDLHHVGIVVRDLDRAVAFYESVGVGPWHDFPSLEPFTHDLVGPAAEDLLRLRFKYADLGNVQLHLCEPPEGDTPQRRFLDEQGEGVFNLSFSVPDVDAAESQLGAQGVGTVLHGRKADGLGFTYFGTRDEGSGVVLQVRSAT